MQINYLTDNSACKNTVIRNTNKKVFEQIISVVCFMKQTSESIPCSSIIYAQRKNMFKVENIHCANSF